MVGFGEWSCARCGAVNASTDLFCGSCGVPAPPTGPAAAGPAAASGPGAASAQGAGPAPPASPNDGLRCQRCSGLNYGDATFCAVCGASLAGAPRVPIAPEPAVPYAPSAPTAGEGRRRRRWSIVLFVVLALLVIGAAVGAVAWVLLSGDDEGSDVAAVASPEPQATTTGAAASPVASPAATGDTETLAFATALEDLMYASGEGRQDIIDAVNGFNSGSMSTGAAAGLIQGVIDNRNAVLDELAVLYVPNEQDADEIVRAFRKGIEFSVEADEYYLDWVYGSSAAYDKAGDAGTKAGRWKTEFVDMYNPFARRLGLRHDWRQLDI